MRVLAVGDVVGVSACEFLRRRLPGLRRELGIDLCIVNGENAAKGNGVTQESCESIFDAGADVITTGNHVFQKREVYDYLDDTPMVVRPCNLYPAAPGHGWTTLDVGAARVLVVNLMGRVYLEAYENPFAAMDKLLREQGAQADVVIVDFHAEATSEKIAMAHHLDGRAALLFGTHTHVPTADECIFPGGLGYITDVGMTGPIWSVIGVDSKNVLLKFTTQLPQRFEACKNPVRMQAIVAEIDEKMGKTTKIERLILE
ncbi:MAG: TIGR00282 family metallophosphoesterase [Eubacteriales bacterium]|jgi:metallophosphoesterase (TIGR00282 family)